MPVVPLCARGCPRAVDSARNRGAFPPAARRPSRLRRALGHQALRTEAVGTLRWLCGRRAGSGPRGRRAHGLLPVPVSAARGCAARTQPSRTRPLPGDRSTGPRPHLCFDKAEPLCDLWRCSDLAPEPTSQAAAFSPWLSQDTEMRSTPKWEHRVPCETHGAASPVVPAARSSLRLPSAPALPLFSPLPFFSAEFRFFGGRVLSPLVTLI